ncbi:MAG: spore cortex-lytic enzyme [Eubacteriales bacterium]|nr:spore cortex-lytic enzyme [Eubacteriales bacterium]
MGKKLKVLFLLLIISYFSLAGIGSGSVLVPFAPCVDEYSCPADITRVQQRLGIWGYFEAAANGIFDKSTLTAISEFQYAYGLPVTGRANRETLFAMGLINAVEAGVAYAAGSPANDEQLIARAINGEARGEVYEGQVAVGAVILNRTRDSHFPNTVAGVIYQPGAFTAVSDGQINVPIDAKSTVVKAARDALNGWDPTGGALYYWNPATATSKWIWSRQIVKTIGKHHFGK